MPQHIQKNLPAVAAKIWIHIQRILRKYEEKSGWTRLVFDSNECYPYLKDVDLFTRMVRRPQYVPGIEVLST